MTIRVELEQGSTIGRQSGVVRIYENNVLTHTVAANIQDGHGANMELYPSVKLELIDEKARVEKSSPRASDDILYRSPPEAESLREWTESLTKEKLMDEF